MALLRFDRKRGHRPGFQPLNPDRLAGFLAIAVGAVFNPLQGVVDLADQLAGTVFGPQVQARSSSSGWFKPP